MWFGRRGAGVKLRGVYFLRDDGGKRAVLRGEHEVSRKAIAQGRPECSRCPVCSCAVFCLRKIARGTAGAASTRSSLRPPTGGRKVIQQTSGDQRREIAKSYSTVIVRLVRNCALGRTIQYSRESIDGTISRGVLDTPPSRGMTIVWRFNISSSLRAQRSNPFIPDSKCGLLRFARK